MANIKEINRLCGSDLEAVSSRKTGMPVVYGPDRREMFRIVQPPQMISTGKELQLCLE
ncbi:hypothetical protein [Desulfatiglans anilini]|uniref:hypothetical protein n=1 Tax=Desulfatiglans anilini TaxID=90728 RepID=UPI0004095D33|nr:hypothetical protein [Desulfatiglans anilini]